MSNNKKPNPSERMDLDVEDFSTILASVSVENTIYGFRQKRLQQRIDEQLLEVNRLESEMVNAQGQGPEQYKKSSELVLSIEALLESYYSSMKKLQASRDASSAHDVTKVTEQAPGASVTPKFKYLTSINISNLPSF